MTQTVQVDKANLADMQVVTRDSVALAEGAVRLAVESFSVTANNITYAVIGDMFGYWHFFPGDGGKGIVPMWGHAIVEASNHADIVVGERLYGYLPMASHLDILPGKISAGGLTDMAEHRQPMSPFYNQYSRLATDPEHDPAREDARMIFGPLFKTGFLIESMFARGDWFGAEQMVLTSASSKTAMALAHCAKSASPQIKRIGLTSAGNVGFVQKSALYDQVLAYGDLETLPKARSVSVDFAGNAAVLGRIHAHFADDLAYSCLVGVTHVDARGTGLGDGGALAGAAPILFFAPDYATALIKDIGVQAFAQAISARWHSFIERADHFMRVDRRSGLHAAVGAFGDTLAGKADPAIGIVIVP